MKNKFLDNFDGDGAEKIVNIIASEILGIEQKALITQRYKDLRDNFDAYTENGRKGDDEKTLYKFSSGLTPYKPDDRDTYYTDTTAVPIPVTHLDFKKLRADYIEQEQVSGAVIGFDMPTWFNLSEADCRIMVVAQDPLRNPKWYERCEDAICSTPFGLHSIEWRENGRGGKRLYTLADHLVKAGYGIYFTDIFKFYVKAVGHTVMQPGTNLLNAYRSILTNEIDIIRPTTIVALGKQAQRSLELMDLDIRSIALPHFSGCAQSAIKQYFGIEGKLSIDKQAELYFNEITSKING